MRGETLFLSTGLDLIVLKPRPLHEKEVASRTSPKEIMMESHRAVKCGLFRSTGVLQPSVEIRKAEITVSLNRVWMLHAKERNFRKLS